MKEKIQTYKLKRLFCYCGGLRILSCLCESSIRILTGLSQTTYKGINEWNLLNKIRTYYGKPKRIYY